MTALTTAHHYTMLRRVYSPEVASTTSISKCLAPLLGFFPACIFAMASIYMHRSLELPMLHYHGHSLEWTPAVRLVDTFYPVLPEGPSPSIPLHQHPLHAFRHLGQLPLQHLNHDIILPSRISAPGLGRTCGGLQDDVTDAWVMPSLGRLPYRTCVASDNSSKTFRVTVPLILITQRPGMFALHKPERRTCETLGAATAHFSRTSSTGW